VYNARLRHDRAYAHASNARLLFNAGDLDSAVIEAKTAAELDPDLGVARYVNAAMMSVTGQTDAAVQELSAAVKLDAKFGAQAADDQDFAELRRRDDFKALLP
jgi:tetratricopeptide (TPR) repeat protein